MTQNNFIQKFNTYKKYVPTDKEILHMQTAINKFIPLAQYFIKAR